LCQTKKTSYASTRDSVYDVYVQNAWQCIHTRADMATLAETD